MVPSDTLKAQLQSAVDEMNAHSLNIHDYRGPAFDAAFDLVTLETSIAGIADQILTGQGLTTELSTILRQPVIEGEGEFINHLGQRYDLSEEKQLWSQLLRIERARQLALKLN